VGKVLSAQGSGWFPTCITYGAASDPTNFGLDCTIVQGMSLYWKTRTWRVNASGGYRLYNSPGGQPDLVASYSGGGEIVADYLPSYFSNDRITPSSEENLLCLGDYIRDMSSQNIFITLDNGTFSCFFNVYLFFSAGYLNQTKVNPYFELDTGGKIQNGGQAITEKVGTLRMSFDGYDLDSNLYYWDRVPEEYSNVEGNVLFHYTCTEYWSYGDTYDTATGEPL